jgi:hypothetical protein
MPRGKRNGAALAAPAAPAVPLAAAHEATQEAREAAAPLEQAPAAAPAPAYDYSALTAGQREDPRFLQGEDLRRFAHKRGMSLSEIGRCSDQKLRQQLDFITYRQYER